MYTVCAGGTLIILAASQHGCIINAIDCMYSKLPPGDEQLIYSKHLEDIYWNKFKKKLHLVGSYFANSKFIVYHITTFFITCWSVPWVRRSRVPGLPPWRPRFCPTPVHVTFVVERMALGNCQCH